MKYSIIIPVYNRPEEVSELLHSLTQQTNKDFEVLIVEDGSNIRSDQIAEQFLQHFPIRYFFKHNEGPGIARNYGFQQASGSYFVVFDSDCIIPPNYFAAVDEALAKHNLDAWGGPDRPHENFTLLQRAMGYTMSSFLTTGGIRGGKKRVGWFQPRSFNMGISRRVFEETKGFRAMRVAEDVELSIRMRAAGFKVALVEDAYVYHKRRTDFSQFFRQVKSFGSGRAQIGKLHPGEVKITHWFPSLFLIAFVFMLLVLPFISTFLFSIAALFFTLYFLAIFLHSLIANKSLLVALLSVPSAFIQLTGYGLGFLKESLKPSFIRRG